MLGDVSVRSLEERDIVMDAREASAYLKLNVQTLRRLARERGIPCFKVGGTWRFKKSTLDAWMEGRDDTRSEPVVLLVDDDAIVRDLFRRILTGHGFRVVCADGGRQALEWLQEERPALLILDLIMPEMNGAETLSAVRARHPFLPVILITGYPDSELLNQALENSPFALLPKPVSTNRFLETVKWAIGGENLPAALR